MANGNNPLRVGLPFKIPLIWKFTFLFSEYRTYRLELILRLHTDCPEHNIKDTWSKRRKLQFFAIISRQIIKIWRLVRGVWTKRGRKVWRMGWWRRSWMRKRLSLCLACLASSLWSSWSTWDAAWLESRSQTFTSRRRARFATFYNNSILLKIIL